MSQLRLLPDRRFAALFWTQFLGAFNDNLLRSAIAFLIAYRGLRLGELSSASTVALTAALFIVPFVLFSSIAGRLADRVSKASLLRWCKLAEIAIAALAAVAFAQGSVELMLGALFLKGSEAAFFGPAKYSVLPELLGPRELTGGNALVASSTFVAILSGTLAGGWLALRGDAGLFGAALVGTAVIGWAASRFIPQTPAAPGLAPYRGVRANRAVFLSVLALSWFWFFGAAVIHALPEFAGERNVTLFLATLCAGIALGALLCERIGGEKLELGLVPVGSLGMTALGAAAFFAESLEVLVVAFFLLGVFGGLYTVPLYTMIQQRAEPGARSRVIARNNVLNALFMLGAALLVGLEPRWLFALLAVANGLVAAYIYTVIPEFLLRFVAWMLAGLMYRIRVTGAEHIPDEGPAVLVANHVTFVDWLLISTLSHRPIRFVMHYVFMKLPLVGFIFRDAKVIPIAGAKESKETLDAAFDRIAAALADGELVCIFPEGALTRDGKMAPFRPGIERIIARTPVPVIPLAITGMWGSFFSHAEGKMLREPFRRIRSRVALTIGGALPPGEVTAAGLEQRVAALTIGAAS